jgi:hypothetical protein
MNEPTPAPATDAATALPAPSAPESVLSASVPAPAPPASSSSLDDQLPTSRLQSLPLELPPPVPPHGPAHKTQPLRPITREAAEARLASEARLAKEAKRRRWQAMVAHVKRVAVAVPSRLRSATWTRQRVGVLLGVVGVAMIACALGLGWQSVASERLASTEHVSLAVALVVARAAMAIAAMFVGYGLLRVGERTLAAGRGTHRELAARGEDIQGEAS